MWVHVVNLAWETRLKFNSKENMRCRIIVQVFGVFRSTCFCMRMVSTYCQFWHKTLFVNITYVVDGFKLLSNNISIARLYIYIYIYIYIHIYIYTQGVSRLVDITAWGDFLGLCDQKVHINMCPVLVGYGVITAWNLEEKVTIIDNKRNKIINQHSTWYI